MKQDLLANGQQAMALVDSYDDSIVRYVIRIDIGYREKRADTESIRNLAFDY